VVDGGSTDETIALAESYGCKILHNPLRRTEPGTKLGIEHAKHPIRVQMAADNAFPTRDWLTRVVGIFERAEVRGVYTHVEHAPEDPRFCRYFNTLHADPFNWFVFGAAANPRRFGDLYPLVEEGADYRVYDLARGDLPLLAQAQGFALRGDVMRNPDNVEDDILPLWELLDAGERFAYCDVGIQHHTVTGIRDFLHKYHRRATNALMLERPAHRSRHGKLSVRRRARRWLWIPYALSIVAPAWHAIRGLIHDRETGWLYHPVACLGLALTMADAVRVARRTRAQ